MSMIQFTSGAQLCSLCAREGISISEAMLRREIAHFEVPEEAVKDRMRHSFEIMKASVAEGQTEEIRSMGGLIGGEARRMKLKREAKGAVCGEIAAKAASYAMGVLEVNASMGLIVAAPTAGSSGVIPGVLCAVQETYGFSDDEMVMALFNAGAIGYLQANGDLDFCIGIRCTLRQGSTWTLQAGGGIVYDSTPEREWEETNEKLGALRAVIQGS